MAPTPALSNELVVSPIDPAGRQYLGPRGGCDVRLAGSGAGGERKARRDGGRDSKASGWSHGWTLAGPGVQWRSGVKEQDAPLSLAKPESLC